MSSERPHNESWLPRYTDNLTGSTKHILEGCC